MLHVGAILTAPDGRYQIFYTLSGGFRHWMIYNGGGNSGFICIEPQTWMINAPNLNLPATQTGLILLEPGCSRTDRTMIYTRSLDQPVSGRSGWR
jgi:aldose 1-epimerase